VVTTIAADLARPEAVAELVFEIERRALDVEVLVNNAGFAS
jgi:short-subunit dehydrogenase